jgi:hypothetical protein
MIKFNLLIATLLFTLLLFSCEKAEEEEVNIPLSTLLTGTESKTWVMTAYTYNESDHFKGAKECVTDNLYTFYINGTFEVKEGATKCNEESDDLVREGTWSINEAKEEFTMQVTSKIVSLTENKFIYEYANFHTREVITLEKVN